MIASTSWRQLALESPDQKIPEDDVIIDYAHTLTVSCLNHCMNRVL